MSLESAQGSFLSLVQTLDSSVTREHFFRWLRENLDEAEAASGGDGVAHATLVEARRNLSVIAQDLRWANRLIFRYQSRIIDTLINGVRACDRAHVCRPILICLPPPKANNYLYSTFFNYL